MQKAQAESGKAEAQPESNGGPADTDAKKEQGEKPKKDGDVEEGEVVKE
jgi:hypothetical protein